MATGRASPELWVTALGRAEQLMALVGIFVWAHSEQLPKHFNYLFVTVAPSSQGSKNRGGLQIKPQSEALWIMKMEEEVWETRSGRIPQELAVTVDSGTLRALEMISVNTEGALTRGMSGSFFTWARQPCQGQENACCSPGLWSQLSQGLRACSCKPCHLPGSQFTHL